MNVLPLVLLLLLTLSALTIQQMENFKNIKILHKEYADFIQYEEGKVLNQHQRGLYNGECYKTRQLYFGAFMGNNEIPLPEAEMNQLKLITKEFMKILYGQTEFYKTMEKKRPNFLDDLLVQIELAYKLQASLGNLPKNGRVENLAQIKLADPELQHVFYHMLKGTVPRKDWRDYQGVGSPFIEKTYVSFLDFIKYNKAAVTGQPNESVASVSIYHAPPELLLAIYESPGVVEAIINKRKEIHAKKNVTSDEKKVEFKQFLAPLPKKNGVDDSLLRVVCPTTDPEDYD